MVIGQEKIESEDPINQARDESTKFHVWPRGYSARLDQTFGRAGRGGGGGAVNGAAPTNAPFSADMTPWTLSMNFLTSATFPASAAASIFVRSSRRFCSAFAAD